MTTERIFYRGSDEDLEIQLLKQSGSAYPVTGATITAQLRDLNKDSTANGAEVTCGSGLSGANFDAGTIIAPWTDTETSALSIGRYKVQVNITLSGGSKKKTVPDLVINVKDSV